MDDVSNLELRVAEQFAVFFADQQTRQGQQVIVGLRTQAGQQFLGFHFEFCGERLLKRHKRLRG